MTAVLRYTVLRIALFVAALAVLALLGASQLTALVGAAVVSLLLSYVLLRGPRDAAALAIAERTRARLDARNGTAADGQAPDGGRRRSRIDEDAAAEDAAVEHRATGDEHRATGDEHQATGDR